ncbi:MAG: YgiQ family radical SAM protein, partial [Methanoregula sp.]
MSRQPPFLPMSLQEGEKPGIRQFDIILITGDAYVDHPSFGTALIGRVLWDAGFSVGIIAQPQVQSPEDFTVLGKPRLFFGISSGNVDSMVDNYTPNLKRRSEDVYSPGGILKRPDRATIVYTNRVHELFPGVPVVIGGIEASLRRFAHYDYWQDRVRQSILADAPADLLVFGMGERQMVEIAKRLATGESVNTLRDIRGTSCKMEIA